MKIEQKDGNWVGSITSENPEKVLQTPGLSGEFLVTVKASGPNFDETTLEPEPYSKPDIGCNSNCAGMVGIVVTDDHAGARYWTVWDAVCSRQQQAA